jgi:hypothetical protein
VAVSEGVSDTARVRVRGRVAPDAVGSGLGSTPGAGTLVLGSSSGASSSIGELGAS